MNKKVKIILWLIFSFLGFFVLLIMAGIWVYLPPSYRQDRLYYVPEIGMYFKVEFPRGNANGYVIISKDSICSLSGGDDYVEIQMSDISNITLLFDPVSPDKMVVGDDYGYILKIHSVNFEVTKTERWADPRFFKELYIPGYSTVRILKCPYIGVNFKGYLQSVYLINCDERYYVEINPIN